MKGTSRLLWPTLICVACLTFFCGKGNKKAPPATEEQPAAAAWQSNLAAGGEVDLGMARVRIAKIAESPRSPFLGKPPKRQGNKFVVIEMETIEVNPGAPLNTIGFILEAKDGASYQRPGFFGIDFEGADGATAAVYEKGKEIKIFFEVPASIPLANLNLFYTNVSAAKD